MDDIIIIKNVSKAYKTDKGEVLAIKNFSMEAKEGDFITIVGPSGCGKTTFLWGLTGLHNFTSGEAIILGEKIEKPRREVGIIFQQANLLPWRNLINNIYFPLEIMRENINGYKERVKELIDSVGLSGFENSYPRELSGGMQQRASIVRALSYNPRVLLMDEPFGSLDAYTRSEMDTLLLDIWERTKKTIIFVTHRIEEAVYLSDTVYVMSPRPAVNSAIFEINLPRPRPRSITTEQIFFDIVINIQKIIEKDVEKQKEEGKYQSQAYSTIA
ncbi:MAG: ABC transporter ATP-binding protein [Actinobacteria bacterium]|nr:ABC transporter ATP-binding protein [Actinomycetota bacterium]